VRILSSIQIKLCDKVKYFIIKGGTQEKIEANEILIDCQRQENSGIKAETTESLAVFETLPSPQIYEVQDRKLYLLYPSTALGNSDYPDSEPKIFKRGKVLSPTQDNGLKKMTFPGNIQKMRHNISFQRSQTTKSDVKKTTGYGLWSGDIKQSVAFKATG
jgi:hypothetical protein